MHFLVKIVILFCKHGLLSPADIQGKIQALIWKWFSSFLPFFFTLTWKCKVDGFQYCILHHDTSVHGLLLPQISQISCNTFGIHFSLLIPFIIFLVVKPARPYIWDTIQMLYSSLLSTGACCSSIFFLVLSSTPLSGPITLIVPIFRTTKWK